MDTISMDLQPLCRDRERAGLRPVRAPSADTLTLTYYRFQRLQDLRHLFAITVANTCAEDHTLELSYQEKHQ